MIVKLFCPRCVYEKTRNFNAYAAIEVPVPLTQITDTGEYEVTCEKGHVSTIVLDNIKFELLFEMGLNAIIDGYHREAVSSFTSALERFYEFYWRVVMKHQDISSEVVASSWKHLSKFSERQLGAYISVATFLTKKTPILLNANTEVVFRNKVIHNGYIPIKEETIIFGDAVMKIINTGIEQLRLYANDALESIYKDLSPYDYDKPSDDNDDIITGCINILTAIDVRYPPKTGDKRIGGVQDQFKRIIEDRQPTKMHLCSSEEVKERFLNKK